MRMRMNNEDEVSRLARERKEARELELKGIEPVIVVAVENPSEFEFVEEVEEEKPSVKKVVLKKKIIKKKGRK